MTADPDEPIMIPAGEFGYLLAEYCDLMNALQAEGHDLRDVVTAGFFALGSATAQGGGEIPDDLLLKDMDPFRHGYADGLRQLKKHAQ